MPGECICAELAKCGQKARLRGPGGRSVSTCLLETRNVLSQAERGFFVGEGATQPRERGEISSPNSHQL